MAQSTIALDMVLAEVDFFEGELRAIAQRGAEFALGLIDQRIFNDHQDANGETIGPEYSKRYAAYRRRRGLSDFPVDLQFTGALRRGLKLIESTSGFQVIIEEGTPARRSRDLEETTYPDLAIFEYSREELDRVEGFLRDIEP